MKLVRLLSLALVAGAFGGLGCSSSSSGTTVYVKTDGGTDTKVTSDTGGATNPTTNPPTDSGGTPPGACDVDAGVNCSTASCGDSNSCFDCVISADTAGYQAYVTALTSACACAAGSTCYSACNGTDVCGGANTTHTACVTCVNGLASSDACLTTFQTKCQANSACVAFATTAQNSCP
jgi:hypothetical protein